MSSGAIPPAPELAPSGSEVRLIVSVTVAPALWLFHLIASFALVRFTCASNADWLLHGLSALVLLIAGAASWVGWREWRTRATSASDAEDRNRFVAAVGVGSSVLFTAIVALTWIASFVIKPCDLV